MVDSISEIEADLNANLTLFNLLANKARSKFHNIKKVKSSRAV